MKVKRVVTVVTSAIFCSKMMCCDSYVSIVDKMFVENEKEEEKYKKQTMIECAKFITKSFWIFYFLFRDEFTLR